MTVVSRVAFLKSLMGLFEFFALLQFFANQSYKHPYTTIFSIPTDFTLSIYHDPQWKDESKMGVGQWN